ncbi:MAG: TonB-dependent receptor [Giesbergeria sp.]|nr:TonB-dependent receptor [Giesbergeria sp.]
MHHTTIARPRTLLLALPSLFAATLALAQAPSQSPVLETVDVREKLVSDITTAVTGEAVQATAARSLGEMLRDETAVSVGGGAAIAQKLYIRGVEDSMLNTTLDGAAQSGRAFHHQSRLLIDPELIQRVEIDRGVAPASAGPGALAGSIRMTTKDARDLLRPGQTLGGTARGGVASNDGQRGGASLFGLVGDQVDFLLSANRDDNDDYRAGNGSRQTYSGSTQTSGLAKLNWRLAPGHKLSLGYQSVQDEGTRYLRPNFWLAQGNSLMPQETTRDTLTATYLYDGGAALPALELGLFSDTLEVQRTATSAMPQFNKPQGWRFGEKITSDGLNLKAATRVGGSTVRYGLNYHRFAMDAVNARPPAGTGSSGRENSDVKGLFAETSVPLSDRFLLGAGARYDWYGYTDNHGQKIDASGLSPNASLTFMATDALSLRAFAGHTLRGAGLKEAFYVDNTRWKNDPNLRPEKADNVELGFNYANGPWSAKGTVFRQRIDDFLTTTTGTSWRIGNVGTMQSHGYELGLGWAQGPWRTSLAVADARPKLNGFDLGDEAYGLGVSTGRSWNLGVARKLAAWNLEVEWFARFVESRTSTEYLISEQRTATKRKAGFGVHDLYINWRPQGSDRLRVTLGVRNLLNQHYYEQGSYAYYVDATGAQTGRGFTEPGRNVRLDVHWKF